ncbi:hypothetical protein PCL_11308 [Purpureocillium lilacinum]|uniref:Mitochondrial carrier protein n=1 Tax=Purpureocillium lilacinum TaxID=33203 RepID=A0A2U3DPV6_PURLI|nr:hypothetical protein PCL_11308 [Purpureocillium lilacinum]
MNSASQSPPQLSSLAINSQSRQADPWVHLLAGASGGIVTSIVTSPLDVLRTRLQSDLYRSSPRPSVANRVPWSPFCSPLRHVYETFDTIGTIRKTEGWGGLFRGLGPSLAGVVPAAAVKYYVYGNCKHLGARYLGFAEDESFIHAQAAVTAGIATATATNPIWLVKTRLQLDRANGSTALRQYRGSLDCIQQVLKAEGVAGFYRGLSASYLGTVETVIHLVLYERLKIFFRSRRSRRGTTTSSEDELMNWASTSGAAGCAKVAAVLATYPHEVHHPAPVVDLKLTPVLGCTNTIAPDPGTEREPGIYWSYRVLPIDIEARGLARPLRWPHATFSAVDSVGCTYAWSRDSLDLTVTQRNMRLKRKAVDEAVFTKIPESTASQGDRVIELIAQPVNASNAVVTSHNRQDAAELLGQTKVKRTLQNVASRGVYMPAIGAGGLGLGPILPRWANDRLQCPPVRHPQAPCGTRHCLVNLGFSKHKIDRLSVISLRIANARMVPPHPSLCSPSTAFKRQNPFADEQPTDNTTAHLSKKRKLAHPSCPPPQFWDGLSKIFLTTNALRELNRRNSRRENRRENSTRTKKPQPTVAPRRSSRLRSSRARAEIGDPSQRVEQGHSTHPKHLKRFATHGGPDLSDLRGIVDLRTHDEFYQLIKSRAPEATGPYDRDFQQHLVDHGIYPDRYRYPDGRAPSRPINLDDIKDALSQPRPSLSPSQMSDGKFEEFQQADADASKESQVITDVIPLIEGTVRDRKCVARQTPFTNLDHLTDGTLVAASPDLCYGARPEQLDRRVRDVLSGRVVPSTQADLPVAPNFFVEVKGPDGSAAVAQRQIIYDMALGEWGQSALRSVGGERLVHDQHAHTLGYTYQNGTVRLYAMHMIGPSTSGPRPEFVTTQVNSYSLTGNPKSFREGIMACRNGRDWAKRQRDLAIAQANEKATGLDMRGDCRRDELSLLSDESAAETPDLASQATITDRGSKVTSAYDSDTSADELSIDFRPDKRAKGYDKRRSVISRKLRQSSIV